MAHRNCESLCFFSKFLPSWSFLDYDILEDKDETKRAVVDEGRDGQD